MTDKNQDRTPAQWLIRQFEKAETDRLRVGHRRTVVIQPMIKLKGLMDAGNPMRIRVCDYRDPGRRWL